MPLLDHLTAAECDELSQALGTLNRIAGAHGALTQDASYARRTALMDCLRVVRDYTLARERDVERARADADTDRHAPYPACPCPKPREGTARNGCLRFNANWATCCATCGLDWTPPAHHEGPLRAR